jgi:Ca2+-transporting ATPase
MAADTHAPDAPTLDTSIAWHALEATDALRVLATGETGLRSDDAQRRLEVYGPNELQAVERSSAAHILAAQFKNVLVLILLVATALSAVLGHSLEAAVIAVIVLFAVLLIPIVIYQRMQTRELEGR